MEINSFLNLRGMNEMPVYVDILTQIPFSIKSERVTFFGPPPPGDNQLSLIPHLIIQQQQHKSPLPNAARVPKTKKKFPNGKARPVSPS